MKKINLKSNAVLQGLLDYLGEKGEEDLLPEVTRSLEAIVAKTKKAEEILVYSAIPFTDEQLIRLKTILKKLLNIDLPIIDKVDKKLIGGFTIKVKDWFLDASLLHQLHLIRQQLLI